MSETIAAIASPAGKSAIAVIRISGERAIACTRKFISNASTLILSRKAIHSYIIDPQTSEIIDEIIFIVYYKPASYTGEDLVEVFCHGNPVIATRILDLYIRSGVRIAGPGEFTKRAFMNGKMDLSKAESVMNLIESENQDQCRAALAMVSGGFSKPMQDLRESVLEVMSGLELDLDFPEEEPSIPLSQTLERLRNMECEISNLIAAGDRGSRLKQGTRIVLTGPVNAGKSRLFNRLLGQDRAIVTDEPGTTRDILESDWVSKNISCILIDTAGLRQTASIAEKAGIDRAWDALAAADIIVYLIDGAAPEIETLAHLRKRLPEKNIVCVWNKLDIEEPVMDVKRMVEECFSAGCLIAISAKTGQNIDILKSAIEKAASEFRYDRNDFTLLLSLRQSAALDKIKEWTDECIRILRNSEPAELAIEQLRTIHRQIGDILGDFAPADVLDSIFSRFCIGK